MEGLEPEPELLAGTLEAVGALEPAPPRRGVHISERGALHLSEAQKVDRETSNVFRVIAQQVRAHRSLYGEEMGTARDAFRLIDKDGNQSLDASELKDALHRLGAGLTDGQIYEVFDAVDTDAGGTIDVDEFVSRLEAEWDDRHLPYERKPAPPSAYDNVRESAAATPRMPEPEPSQLEAEAQALVSLGLATSVPEAKRKLERERRALERRLAAEARRADQQRRQLEAMERRAQERKHQQMEVEARRAADASKAEAAIAATNSARQRRGSERVRAERAKVEERTKRKMEKMLIKKVEKQRQMEAAREEREAEARKKAADIHRKTAARHAALLSARQQQQAEARDALARKESKEQEAEFKRQRKLVADRMVREKHSEELAYKMHSAR